MDVELLIIAYQFFTITAVASARAILQYFTIDIPYRINRDLWCGQIRLSDVQVEHMHSSLFGSIGKRSQFSDRRSRHFVSANGYDWHKAFYYFLFTIYNLEGKCTQ